MFLTKFLPSLALTLSLCASVQAVITGNAIAAFSKPNCDGDMGAIVPCDSSCHQFTGRQSHLVSVGLVYHSLYTNVLTPAQQSRLAVRDTIASDTFKETVAHRLLILLHWWDQTSAEKSQLL